MLVVVATVNAVNFVDGLDGLAAGVVGIGALAFFLFCYCSPDINDVTLATTGALLSAALAGVCAGFLPHNFHPARLFMGDSRLDADRAGALGQRAHPDRAVRRDQTRGRRRLQASLLPTLLPLLLPIAILMVPFADLVLAVVRRTGPAGRRSRRTSSTCTTGCWRSATRTAARC